jgi:hypothetical protein
MHVVYVFVVIRAPLHGLVVVARSTGAEREYTRGLVAAVPSICDENNIASCEFLRVLVCLVGFVWTQSSTFNCVIRAYPGHSK